jgi:hypothetical protein
MKKLVDSGLFGGGLTLIESPELVSRYNACLVQLGITPTNLPKFNVDGIGWSPEIAHEKGDASYLSAGIANPMGVIVTPNQRKKPVYYPFNSYDRRLMEIYFDRFHQAIADVTGIRYIGLDFDAELSSYESPCDLLLVHYVILRSVAGGLFDAAKDQRKHVERFMSDSPDWFNPALRAEIIRSGKEWGDLRYVRTDIPDLKYEVGSFHTNAFGGVFVFRLPNGEALLIFEGEDRLPHCSDKCDKMYVNDPYLPARLLEENLVEVDTDWYSRHPEVLLEKMEGIRVTVLTDQDKKLDYDGLKYAQKRQLLQQNQGKFPSVYFELERFARRLKNGEHPEANQIPADLSTMLLRPHQALSEEEQEVVWLLLCRLQPLDVYRLYVSDKNRFFDRFARWSESKQDWAIKLLRENYVPRSQQ